jgi:hypothetical protein
MTKSYLRLTCACFLNGNQQRILLSFSVVDPHPVDADPDVDPDPDPSF